MWKNVLLILAILWASSARAEFVIKSAQPVVVPAAYATGDVIGSIVEIGDFFNLGFTTAKIVSAELLDRGGNSAIDVYLFNKTPAESYGADNAAVAVNATDATKVVGRLLFAAADYKVLGPFSTNQVNNLQMIVEAAPHPSVSGTGSTSLFALFVSRGSPIFNSASTLNLKIGVERP